MNAIRKFGCNFRGSRSSILALWALGLAAIGLALVTPFQVGRLTNLFAGGQAVQWAPVERAVLFLIAAQLAFSLISYVRRILEIFYQEAMVHALTLDVFRRILRFSTDFFREREIDKITTRAIDDTFNITRLWISVRIGIPLAVIQVIAFGGMMLYDNWFLGACMIPLALLSSYFLCFDRKIQELNQRDRKSWDTVRTVANEMVAGVSELRNHDAFDYGLIRLKRVYDEFCGVKAQLGRLAALFDAANPLITTLQTGSLYWVGAALCIQGSVLGALAGHMTWGGVMKFALLADLFRQPVRTITDFLLQWRMAHESVRRVNEYLERPCVFAVESDHGELASEAGIAFEDAHVTTADGTTILNGIDFQVEPGQHVALAGPVGCGKSTAMQLIVRGIDCASGRLRLGGSRVERLGLRSLACEVGFVPQKPVLIHDTIRNNLLLGLRRPSARTLTDQDGPIDLSRLPQVKTQADLDRELIHVVRQVGLQDDLACKGLDNPIPAAIPNPALQGQLLSLRPRVAEQLRAAGDGLVLPVAETRGTDAILTVRELILGGRVNTRIPGSIELVDSVLRNVLRVEGLLDAVVRVGLEFSVGEGGKFLSGGQKQKLAIARVMLKDPSILLLDEATSSLDEASQARVVKLIRRRFAGKTVISISHRLATIKRFDRILVMDRGQVVQQGTYSQLVARPGLFRNLVQQERSTFQAAESAETGPKDLLTLSA